MRTTIKLCVLGGALLSLSQAAAAQTLETSFVSNSNDSYSYFGNDLGIDGDVFAIGGDGTVEVWDRTPSGPVFRQELRSPNFTTGFGFGRSVDAAGGVIVVGALAEDVGNADRAGRVYLYRDVAGTYQLEQTIELGVGLGELGWGVDLSSDGSTLLASSPGERAAYWYVDQGGVWTREHRQTFAQPGWGRGSSVFIEGDDAFIGNPFTDRVRWFRRTATGWASQQTVTDGVSGNQQFGWSVSATDRWLVVGMPSFEEAGESLYLNSGAARVFEKVAGSWVPIDYLREAAWGQSNYGGWSVSVQGDDVLVGCYGFDSVNVSAGNVGRYRFDGTAWVADAPLLPPAGAQRNHYFGSCVSMEGGTVLIAADGTDDFFYSGRVYLYSRDVAVGSVYCDPAVPNSTGFASTIEAFGSDRASDDRLELRVAGLPAGEFGVFVVGSDQASIPSPAGSVGTLCVGGGLGRILASLQPSSAAGTIAHALDLTALPIASGAVAVGAGDTWNFQAWHRDVGGTSNFSTAVSVTFR